MRTFKSIRAEYDRLRVRYYMDADEPMLVPPPSLELRWTWCRDPKLWAATHFDEDNDPHLVEAPFGLGKKLTRCVLLHELSHMRNPRAVCNEKRAAGWWRAEGRRLEAFGAFSREGIF